MTDTLLANLTPASQTEEAGVTLAVGFYSDVDGIITSLQWYQPTADTNPAHDVSLRLWQSTSATTGTQIGSTQTILNAALTTSWNIKTVSIPITANTPYKLSAFTARYYGFTGAFFASSGTVVGHLTAYQDGTDGLALGYTQHNGTFVSTDGTYTPEANNFNATWYGIGLTFEPSVTQNISVKGINSTEKLGNVAITTSLNTSVKGIPSAEKFGNPAITNVVNINVNGITSTEKFGRTTVVYDQIFNAKGIKSTEKFGIPPTAIDEVFQSISINGIGSKEKFGRAFAGNEVLINVVTDISTTVIDVDIAPIVITVFI